MFQFYECENIFIYIWLKAYLIYLYKSLTLAIFIRQMDVICSLLNTDLFEFL